MATILFLIYQTRSDQLRTSSYNKSMRKTLVIIAVVLALVLIAVFVFRDRMPQFFFQPTESSVITGERTGWSDVEIVASNLHTPWSVVVLPSGDLLVTERSGTLKRVGSDGRTYPVSGVVETSEGGLLGVALHPDFSKNTRLYLYLTTMKNGMLMNQVEEYQLRDDTLTKQRTILANIPAASNHNGGGIAFGPDDKLYITTGDAAQRKLAQDTSSLAGKILRMNADGTTPEDNPYGNLVWSYGHRNPQGIAWDSEERLWSVEHGPSGEWKGGGKDELNLIEKGANYGWPTIAGDESRRGMRSPIIHSGDNETWAPSGIAYLDGSLFFAGLRGETLYQAKINDSSSVTLTSHFSGEYGRLRAVAAKDGALYFTSSNRDGRGMPQSDDDKIYRLRIVND